MTEIKIDYILGIFVYGLNVDFRNGFVDFILGIFIYDLNAVYHLHAR